MAVRSGPLQMLGLCRFSLLVDGGFQTVHDTLEQRRAMLYDPRRLAARFAWFEQVFLPALKLQTDADFRLVVLTGTDFPRPWRDRLLDLLAGVPQLVAEFRDPGNHREVCRHVLAAHVDPKAAVVGQFRLDDDDAVAFDYIERSRRDFDLFRGLYDRHGLLASDYAKGLAVTDTGRGLEVDQRIHSNWGCGLTIYMPPTAEKAVLDYAHHRLREWMPTVGQSDSQMYVRGLHGGNDSNGRGLGSGTPLPAERAARLLKSRFGIDLGVLDDALRGATVA